MLMLMLRVAAGRRRWVDDILEQVGHVKLVDIPPSAPAPASAAPADGEFTPAAGTAGTIGTAGAGASNQLIDQSRRGRHRGACGFEVSGV